MWNVGRVRRCYTGNKNTEMKESGMQPPELPIPIVVVIVTSVLDRSRWGFGVRFHHNPQSSCVALQITIIVQQ